MNWFSRYANWLHLRWPAGTVEPFPELREGGATRIPGVFVAGDLTGIPLLKFALDSGARLAQRIAADPSLRNDPGAEVLDLVILGAGISGMAAAVEAKRLGLTFEIVESSEPFSTLVNFPRRKPIFTYPTDMTPAGELQVSAPVKEALIGELDAQVARAGIRPIAAHAERIERRRGSLVVHLGGRDPITARRVIVAIGRSGSVRRLEVPGESLDKVANRLHDPSDFSGRRVLVVGGGDSALETAIALEHAGARVTLCHRGTSFARPKAENLRRAEGGAIDLRLGTQVESITPSEVVLIGPDGHRGTIANDAVFVMIGREPPLDFFRRSGVPIAREWTARRGIAMALFLAFCAALYNWKSGGALSDLWNRRHWFPTNLPDLLRAAGGGIAAAAARPETLLGTLAISAAGPAFWYTLAYSLVVAIFGARRIRRRRTPYVTVQTLTLIAVQILPLFLIPEVVLPLLEHNHRLPPAFADALFPRVDYGHGREFWRAYGFILAWPLDVYNIFTREPLWWWIGIGFVQTCVLIPIAIYFFGKGAYCGWICSCGALAETLGDTQRHKMPHGPGWNRLNLAGQGVLGIAILLLLVRIAGWVLPDGNWADRVFDPVLKEHYKWWVDVFLAGVIGYGVYFWYSGRVWCRFFCPLAALMHIYARFSRFRIFADKKKCISCGQCTSVCHQGIDVMSFANKGIPMADPQCVRCSACVQECPTGVLSFGRVGRDDGLVTIDSLRASPVRMIEGA